MSKKKRPVILEVNPRIQQLQEKIAASNAFSKDSIQASNITDLFKILLNQDSVTLTAPVFSNPDDNALQVTAVAALFSQQIKITAVFVADDEDVLSLTMNSFEDTSMLLSAIYQAGLVPGGSTEGYIPAVNIGGISFVLDSDAGSFTLKGTGDQWTFLGYTGLYVKSPALTLVSTFKDLSQSYQWFVSGTLTSDTATVNIPLTIGLPIGFTGWSISAGPLTLDNGLGIIDALTGISVSGMLPEGFTDLLANIEITGFYAGFDPIKKSLRSVQLQVQTKADWVIVQDKLKIKEGISLLLNGFRMEDGQPLQYSGCITGTAAVNYANPEEEVQASAIIPIPLSGADWAITLANDQQPLGFGKLAALVPGVKDFLPPGMYEKLNEIILEYLTIKFKFSDGFSFTNIAFSIYSATPWQLPALQQAIYLDKDFSLALNVPLPYAAATMSGKIAGVIQIDSGNISIPISLSKTPVTENWTLQVTSDEIPLPSISSLSGFMGGGILDTASPSGLMKVGNFAIYDLELIWIFGTVSKLQRFAFTISSTPETPAWNLVPGYFELTELFVSIAIENQSVSDKDISGSIGATVTWVLNKSTNSKLVLFMLATKSSSAAPWKFAGSLKEDLVLKDLLIALHTPAAVVDLLPNLKVTQFDLSIEPTSGSFSIATAIAPVDTWTILTIGSLNVNMENIGFEVQKYAENLEMSASGTFTLVATKKTSTVQLSAGYSNKDWNFSGTYDNTTGGGITINEVLAEYITGIDSASIPQLKILKVLVAIVKGTTATSTTYNTFHFVFSGELTLLDKLLIQANIDVKYDSRNTTSPYEGTQLQGLVKFGGISFTAIAKYSAGRFSNYEFLLTFMHVVAKATVEDTATTTTFRFNLTSTNINKPLTLGDVIAALIEAATGEAPVIPAPWSFILNISINNFGFLFVLNKTTNAKTVGLTWQPKINLGFIVIDELSLLYSPGPDGNNGPVEFRVTKGTFLGMPIDELPQQQRPDWDLRDPSKAPAVPGFGDSSFKLEFLGLGNQVAIKQKTPPASVTQAITNLAEAFNTNGGAKLPPELYFDKNYGILFGAQFIVVKYIHLAVVFYDPVMYGISISVKDGKFKDLYFEILYKKVNDNVGVYQIDLSLPDFVRQQQFGAVAVTLPSISLSVYTNGDFTIDMGFPKNADFSRSFGLEFSIFTGAGGFYFGKLSNDTATMVPKGDGQFNPVIIFGIGIRAGLGKSLNKGPLKAELSLTIQVILEGVLAWYKANPPAQAGNEVLYFRLQAQAALVGRIYGEIDFVIISASLDIMVRIMLQLVLESYRQSLVTFTAEVYASITVRINLGLFKISISCSFRTGITDTFTIGSNEKAPWDTGQLADRSAYFTPLDAPLPAEVPKMVWSAPLDYPAEQLNLLFIPQVSVKYDAAAAQHKQAVAASLLFVQNAPGTADSSAFTVLARAVLAWVFNAYFAGKDVKDEKILDQPVTIEDANAIYNYFDQPEIATGAKDAFQVTDLYDYLFAKAFTSVNISTADGSAQQMLEDADTQVAFFPIIPLLAMTINGGTPLEFSDYNECDTAYLERIRQYFREMQVQYEERPAGTQARTATGLTMAEFLFIDYFVMMAKTAMQDVINGFKQTTLVARADDSFASIAARYKSYGATPAALAAANRHQPLKTSASLHIPAFNYRLRHNETRESFAAQLPVSDIVLQEAGGTVSVPSFLYTIPEKNVRPVTLRSIAARFGVSVEALAFYNADQPGIFEEGTRLLHAFTDTKTVQQILDELQNGAQFQLANLAGVVSRFFLHGLRIPKAATGDDRIALYEGTGQQFNLTGTVTDQSVALNVTAGSPAWLKLGTGTEVTFSFSQDMANAVAELTGSAYVPGITLHKQEDVKRYRLQPRTFALATSFTWQAPDTQVLKTTLGDTFIWAFPPQLQSYLSTYPSIPYQLLLQSANTAFSQTAPTPVAPMYWSTFVTVNLRRVPDSATPGSYADNIYLVDGCGESDGQLLQQVLLAGSPAITNLDILFADNSAKPNNGEEVRGLISNSLTSYTTFLLQTNFSTVSNPGLAADAVPLAASNLEGMDAFTFLTYLWECSIVRSGGYYLHYRTSSGGGLPAFIFDEDGIGAIRVLVSYNIPIHVDSEGYVLPPYVNSAVLDTPVDPQQDTLLAGIALTAEQKTTFDPILQQIQATILPGTGMFSGKRDNPQILRAATLGESADQQLSELFQLMEYRILATTGVFRQSNYALPTGPLDTDESAVNCISRLPSPMQTTTWNYGAVLPVFPFTDNGGAGPVQDPYAANGKTATVYFNFLDIFGNTLAEEGASQITQQLTPGYTDPVIGVDQWINVARTYKIATDTTSKPALSIALSFDVLRYVNATDPKALATQDLKQYRQVALQLAQEGVTAAVECSIGTLEAPAATPLDTLQQYVAAIISYLEQVPATPPADDAPITTTLTCGIDAAQLNAALIFQLSVSINITRTKYIDPQFEQEAAIKSATTIIPPDLYHGTTASETALSVFATALEQALPVMKVAVGAPDNQATVKSVADGNNTTPKDIWLVRFANGTDAGISFTVNAAPVSFGIKPLSTTLISRPDETNTRPVPLRAYTSGKYLGNETVQNKAFAGIDMEVMARTFISTTDTFFSAQSSTQAWRVQQSGKSDYFPSPFQALEDAKRSIARAVPTSQLTNILQDAGIDGLPSAQQALEQQMLTVMGNMYKTDAVIQSAVTVTQGFDEHAANLYGQLVFADTTVAENSYSFTPVKVPLTKGEQQLNSFFSVRQETGTAGAGQDVDLIDRFKAGLNLQITGLEHNFGTPLNGYVPSSWLTFANPILQTGTGSDALMNADIPVPLKAYPTAPSLINQQATPSAATGNNVGEKQPQGNTTNNLEKALLWNYTFSYNYVIARQDLIYLDIQLNTANAPGAALADSPPDLFEALMQFNTTYEAVIADIAREDSNSLIALQSLAWMVKQVADAWPGWFDPQTANAAGPAAKTLNYIIKEEPDADTGNLLITIRSAQPGVTTEALPLVTINGFSTKEFAHADGEQTYYFVEVTDTTETPLLFSERKKFSERGVVIRDNHVLIDENAWAGVAVHRNEELAGQPTNKDFRYITPYIRFANVCYPNLTSQAPINIADSTAGAGSTKEKLETLLVNFFIELLKADPERKVMLQMQAGYSFALQPDAPAALQVGPTLPIVLMTPLEITGNSIAEVLSPLSAAILKWFGNQPVEGVSTTGNLRFIVSLFAFNSGDMHHPVLTLEGVYLPTNVIDFS
ncbi:hypothetical protein [Chitinophaga cymbidii]|uniref:LysM domain-containing protein n=1 Tax=Chitinophaga cymbidii TaxID=1096750 RepID=A0A512RMP5_9BACT|nr:hypothetical protein [Chitinophaga cymbidii]GEP96971.1 hypothetical protein CCY01nite_32310 [Chitinophaga cymbidii]